MINKRNKKGKNNMGTKTTYPYNASSYNLEPTDKEIPNFNDIKEVIEKRTVDVFEYVKGHSVIIGYDHKKKYFDVSYEERSEEAENRDAYTTLEANCNDSSYNFYSNIQKVKNLLGGGRVDFYLFGEFVEADTQREKYLEGEKEVDFFITDIYINKNWVCTDDLQMICDKANIKLLPHLYHGVYNEKAFEVLLNNHSTINKKVDTYAIYIKTIIEDEYKSKRLAAMFKNSKYISQKEIDKNLQEKIADEVLKNHFNDIVKRNVVGISVNGFTNGAYNVKTNVNKERKEKVLSQCVSNTINIYLIAKLYTYIYKYYAGVGKDTYKEIEQNVIKILKKKLPSYFLKSINFV